MLPDVGSQHHSLRHRYKRQIWTVVQQMGQMALNLNRVWLAALSELHGRQLVGHQMRRATLLNTSLMAPCCLLVGRCLPTRFSSALSFLPSFVVLVLRPPDMERRHCDHQMPYIRQAPLFEMIVGFLKYQLKETW